MEKMQCGLKATEFVFCNNNNNNNNYNNNNNNRTPSNADSTQL
jgi:hypothetical protein